MSSDTQGTKHVCPAEHRHGASGTCYTIHKCRCTECRTAVAARTRARNRAKLYGRYVNPYVPMEPVRQHFEMLQAFGLGWKRIGEISGIGSTAASQNSHRRLQALVTRGWSQSKLAQHIGVAPGNLNKMFHHPSISVKYARRIADVYEELWNQTPPREEWRDRISYSRAVNYAKARRWLPPLAWDNIDTDVEPPLALAEHGPDIDEMAIELALAGDSVRLSSEERREAVRRLHSQHLSDASIAGLLRVNPRTILRIRQELGLGAAVGYDREPVVA